MSCSVWWIIPSIAQTSWQMIYFACPNFYGLLQPEAWYTHLLVTANTAPGNCSRVPKLDWVYWEKDLPLSWMTFDVIEFVMNLWCGEKKKKKKGQPLLCIFPSAHPWDSRLFLSSFSLAPLLLPPVRGPAPARRAKAWTFSQGPLRGNRRTGVLWQLCSLLLLWWLLGETRWGRKCSSTPNTCSLPWVEVSRKMMQIHVEKAGKALPTHHEAPLNDLKTTISSSRHFTTNCQRICRYACDADGALLGGGE